MERELSPLAPPECFTAFPAVTTCLLSRFNRSANLLLSKASPSLARSGQWQGTVPGGGSQCRGWGGGFCRILRTSLFCLSLPSHHLKDAVELAGLKPTPGTAVDAGRKSALSSPIGISENKRKNQVLCCPWLMLGHGLLGGGSAGRSNPQRLHSRVRGSSVSVTGGKCWQSRGSWGIWHPLSTQPTLGQCLILGGLGAQLGRAAGEGAKRDGELQQRCGAAVVAVRWVLSVCTQQPAVCPGCSVSSFPGQSGAAPPTTAARCLTST